MGLEKNQGWGIWVRKGRLGKVTRGRTGLLGSSTETTLLSPGREEGRS
jgi:hypothetical protein